MPSAYSHTSLFLHSRRIRASNSGVIPNWEKGGVSVRCSSGSSEGTQTCKGVFASSPSFAFTLAQSPNDDSATERRRLRTKPTELNFRTASALFLNVQVTSAFAK